MPVWRILLEGRNFLLRVDSETQRLGFYTTRFVEADDAQSAELRAVQMVRDDLKSRVLNERSNPPMIYAEQITEVVSLDPDYPNRGYTFYPEDTDA